MRCDHCGNEVPEGSYCTRCGARQGVTAEAGHPQQRLSSYAAHPGEHVFHLNAFSTLMPHLGHQKVHEFRWAFLVGGAALVVLVAAGLIPGAILVAAFFVPLLYLMYLYEAQIYRDEPITVLLLTFGGGIILGWIVTLIADNLWSPLGLDNTLGSVDTGTFVGLLVIVPIVSEIVKVLPAVPLRWRPQFPETVDGLVFGIAAGLGFGLAETLVRFWPTLQDTPFHTDPGNWIVPIISLGVLRAVMQGSTTGLIAAAVWRAGRGRLSAYEIGGVLLAFLAHIGFLTISQALANAGAAQLVVLAWQVLVDAVLLFAIRYILHRSLLEEAAHMGFRETVCPNCHRHVSASGFCPNCGMALTAAPGAVRQTAASGPAGTTPAPEGT